MTKLSEVLTERKEKPDLYAIQSGEMPIVAKIGFDTGKIELREESRTKTNMILIKPGDLVISGINAAKGAIAIYDRENAEPAAATIHYSSYIINEQKADPAFLWYFLRSKIFRKILIKNLPKGIKTEVKPARFLAVEVPLPRLEEQKHIVVKIKSFIAKIQEAKTLREKAINDLEKALEAQLNRLFGDPYINKHGIIDIGDFVRLNDVVTDVADGPHVTPTYVENGIPFITVLNITSGKIDFSNVKYITLDDHWQFQKRAHVEKGDVLISKDGTIGFPCFVDTDREFSFFVSVALIKPKRDLLDGRFLMWSFRVPYLQNRMRERSRGDMICHLVLREIRNLTVPVPPIQKQRRIVAYLDSLQAKADKLKKLQDETGKEMEELVPSILDKAFKGQL